MENVSSDRVLKDFKFILLERLNDPESSLTKSLTLALTIQTMFNMDIEVLELLFRFLIEKNQIEMSVDLWENELLKKHNLNESSFFDNHLDNITTQVIFHLDKKSKFQSQNLASIMPDPRDEFYMKLLLMLGRSSQEKFVILMLEKNKSMCSFLKIEPITENTFVGN